MESAASDRKQDQIAKVAYDVPPSQLLPRLEQVLRVVQLSDTCLQSGAAWKDKAGFGETKHAFVRYIDSLCNFMASSSCCPILVLMPKSMLWDFWGLQAAGSS